MIQPVKQLHDTALTLPMDDFEKTYCVYEHHWHNPDPTAPDDQKLILMYVGYCRLHEVMLFPDARRNTEWQRYFAQGATMTVRIVVTSTNLIECQNVMTELYRKHRPHCNVKGYRSTGRTIITCDQTGETFASVSEAAKQKGLSQSQLNNHINRRAGFKSVRGLTFTRGFDPQ